MMRRLLLILLSCTGYISSALSAEFQYFVVPLKGLTGISQSALKIERTPGPKYSGMIDEKYADYLFDTPAQQALTGGFVASVAKAYPNAVIGAHQVVAKGKAGRYAYDNAGMCGAKTPFTVGYQHAYVLSLGISRVSAYINDYGDKTQILLPVTYTVRFVKLNGASIVFSKSQTIYTMFDAGRSEFYDASGKEISKANLQLIKGAVINDAKKAMASLVDSAVKSFAPKQSTVSLIGRDGPYYIFDKGSEIGFKRGEEFDATDDSGSEYGFAIKYATEHLAVGVVSLLPGYASADRLSKGSTLNFNFDSPGIDDAKYSILAVQYSNNGSQVMPQEQVVDNAMESLLVDDLGFSAPFNVLKQDPDFHNLKVQIKEELCGDPAMYENLSGFADASTVARPDPDLLLKVDHFNSPMMTAFGVGGVTSNTDFNNAVSLSLIDLSGTVRQNFLGSNNYVLSRTDGKGLSVQQATEVNLKNAGLDAVKKMVSGFKPKQHAIKVVSVDKGVASLSELISPATLKRIKLVRPIEAANRQIMLPILNKGEDGVLFEAPSAASDKINYRGLLKTGDLLVQPYADDGANLIKLCERKGIYLMNPALKSPSGLDLALRYAVGANLKSFDYVESDKDFIRSTNVALGEGMFNTRRIDVQDQTTNCLLPLEMQQTKKLECNSGKCSGVASVASGVRIFNGDNKVGESIVGATFQVSEIQETELSGFVGLKMFEHHLKSVDSHNSKLH